MLSPLPLPEIDQWGASAVLMQVARLAELKGVAATILNDEVLIDALTLQAAWHSTGALLEPRKLAAAQAPKKRTRKKAKA